MALQAFDLAERLQTPILVLSDLDIGMNDWMCREFKWDDAYRPDRGKMLDKSAIEKLEKFHRYVDKDGDGITYRTLPGVHPKGAYFTRGSGHTQFGMYTEDSADYQLLLDRLPLRFANRPQVLRGPINGNCLIFRSTFAGVVAINISALGRLRNFLPRQVTIGSARRMA